MNITIASKGDFLDVMDGIIDLFHTYRPNKKCYLEIFKKSMQIILYDGLTPDIAARCYRCHVYVHHTTFKQAQNKSKQTNSFFRSGGGNGNGGGGGGGGNGNGSNGGGTGGGGRTLAFWCFSPSVAMSQLLRLGVRSIILTSGK